VGSRERVGALIWGRLGRGRCFSRKVGEGLRQSGMNPRPTGQALIQGSWGLGLWYPGSPKDFKKQVLRLPSSATADSGRSGGAPIS